MKTFSAISIAALMFAGSSLAEPFGKPLWQNTTVGMTIDEVADAQPGAVAEAKPDHLANGAVCSLKIRHFELSGSEYHVCFFFKAGRLSQVTLSDNDPNEADLRSVVDLLRAKYGSEISKDISSDRESYEWVLKSGVNINVIYMETGSFRLLNINYQTRLLKEADKL